MRSISAEVITTGRLGARSRADGVDGGTVGALSWMICIVSWMKSMVSRRRGTASRRMGTAGGTMVAIAERYVMRSGVAMRAAVG